MKVNPQFAELDRREGNAMAGLLGKQGYAQQGWKFLLLFLMDAYAAQMLRSAIAQLSIAFAMSPVLMRMERVSLLGQKQLLVESVLLNNI